MAAKNRVFIIFFIIFSLNIYSQKRILSLTPSITKILFHLDMENSIVGVTDFCEFNGKVKKLVDEGKIKRVSGFNTINYEKILLLEPDIIIGMDSVSMETKNRLDKLFNNKKIFWFKHPQNFNEIKSQIIEIGKIVDNQKKSIEIVKYIDDQLNDIQKKIDLIPEIKKPKVLVEIFY
ncbi:MAG TPA: ABC transporter substrate-binding protein, partial [Spirochaetota bacterium]|nr:ABC transporter substrate-binding protein [Spirochaetota bacterium]